MQKMQFRFPKHKLVMNYLIDVKPAVTDNSAVSLPETLVHVIMFIFV